MYIVADLTKANDGTLLSVLERLPDGLVKSGQIEAIIQPHQKNELVGRPHVKVTEIKGPDVGADVCRILKERIPELTAGKVVVFSFNSYVLGTKKHFPPVENIRIQFVPWSQARMTRLWADGVAVANSWPLTTITEREACDTLISVLNNSKAFDRTSGLRQTAIRPKLAHLEPRLSKEQTQNVPGFISRLIRGCADSGSVVVDNIGDKNPTVWINATVPSSSGRHSDVMNREQRGQHYIETLKVGKMGPFPNFRHRVFDELERLISGDEPKPTLQDLVRKAVAAVKESFEGSHVGFAWGAVSDFLMELLRLNPVIVDKTGQILRPGFSTLRTEVGSLVEQWRLKLDGELILYLLSGGCEISFHDIPELTGALYVDRGEGNRNTLQDVLEHLHKLGKIEYYDEDSLIKLSQMA